MCVCECVAGVVLFRYVPLSKVDVNMARAHVRDGVRTQKFYFRKHIHKYDDFAACLVHRFCGCSFDLLLWLLFDLMFASSLLWVLTVFGRVHY